MLNSKKPNCMESFDIYIESSSIETIHYVKLYYQLQNKKSK